MPSPRAPRSAATVPAMAIMDSSHAAGARHRSPPSTVRPESGWEPDEAEPSRPDPLQQPGSSPPPPRAVQLMHRRPHLPPRQTRRRDSTSWLGHREPPPPGFPTPPRWPPPAAPLNQAPPSSPCEPTRPDGHPRKHPSSMFAWWRLGAATETPPRGGIPASAWFRPQQHTTSPPSSTCHVHVHSFHFSH
nr:proline-rich receptor-like protein kinase PERK9 [Aegilops tauschii subsp. strangulata]XP_040246261.1 proline-rich receptor-like protein kinase PERK9 [Aegilops tauschii subsp. strangulata]